MIRRTIRLGFCAGLLAGVCFALVKLVQSRRSSPALPTDADWLVPKRPEKPLVEPEMLQGLSLKKEGAPIDDGRSVDDKDDENAPPAAAPEAAAEAGASVGWVEPDGSTCPASHPVKAKLSSGIFHLPGMLDYDRTTPDRCYLDEVAAEADGLRKAKR